MQVLPREAQVTGQNVHKKITIYNDNNGHYIPPLHWEGEIELKMHKESARPGGMDTGQYNIMHGHPNSPKTPKKHVSQIIQLIIGKYLVNQNH